MQRRNRNHKEPTLTLKVEAALALADDFVTATEAARLASITPHQAMSSLIYLRQCHAVESVESNGRLFWFSTKSLDTRIKIVEQRAVEDQPRRSRGSKRTKSFAGKTSQQRQQDFEAAPTAVDYDNDCAPD